MNGTNVSCWEAFFVPLMNVSQGTIWSSSHAIAGLPIAATLFNTSAVLQPFFAWYFAWLGRTQDVRSGYWVENPRWAPPAVDGLGGAFHMLLCYRHLGRAWPRAAAVLNTSLAMQQASGLWGGAAQAGFIDLDGLWTALRSAEALGRVRWPEVRAMCERFLASQVPLLNDAAAVLDARAAWSVNTHSLMAPLAAVAECQRAFPGLVRTTRPWVDIFAGPAPW